MKELIHKRLVSYQFDNILLQNFVETDRQTMASLPPTTLPNPPVPVPRPSGRTTNPVGPISRQGRGTPRRSSSRSIKRKKFDDELVESSLKKASKQRVDITGLEKEVKRPMVKFNMILIAGVSLSPFSIFFYLKFSFYIFYFKKLLLQQFFFYR